MRYSSNMDLATNTPVALQWAVLAAAWLSIGLDAPLWVPLAATGVFVAKSVLELYLMVHYEREM